MEVFLADAAPGAYERMVDRYLASPHYGEQRAHYWLDAVRYADTNGIHFDNYREIWPYRDWVIAAFNRNQPFKQFAIDQIAGDLEPNPTLEQRIATGFQRANVTTNEAGIIEDEYAEIYAKDRADTFGSVFLGLTVGCATCHDHKFDPISQKDYYSLGAFFRNTPQRIMDGNASDQPPFVIVPQAKDRGRWEEIQQRQAAIAAQMSHLRDDAPRDGARRALHFAFRRERYPLHSRRCVAFRARRRPSPRAHGRTRAALRSSGRRQRRQAAAPRRGKTFHDRDSFSGAKIRKLQSRVAPESKG